MALHHAVSGELIDIRPLGEKLPESASVALFKTAALEVMRLVLIAGHDIPEHCVAGEITFQCLEGKVELRAHGKTQPLEAGTMVFLEPNVGYSLRAIENASVLMTVLVEHE
jgi:quercetin dioxygenase-like cupin family protein